MFYQRFAVFARILCFGFLFQSSTYFQFNLPISVISVLSPSSIRSDSASLGLPMPGRSFEHTAIIWPLRHRPRLCQLLEGAVRRIGRRPLCVRDAGHSRRSRLARHCTEADLFIFLCMYYVFDMVLYSRMREIFVMAALIHHCLAISNWESAFVTMCYLASRAHMNPPRCRRKSRRTIAR